MEVAPHPIMRPLAHFGPGRDKGGPAIKKESLR